ncbi:MAG TPA: proline dehydrogenase family protein, partial [Nitrospiraceae bacterium]|nr:proline dehydrogenase family protein [Nitrospiraceae bacterium]
MDASIETRVRAIGEELARRSTGLSPGLFDSRWWSQAAINLAMKDPSFKAQLFRFIDVLPALREDAQVVRLAEEYFGDMTHHLFGVQWGFKALAATTLGATLTGKTIRHQVEHMARTFIAGDSVAAALPALRALWDGGRAFSVDLLGEATVSEQEADRYAARCLDALHDLGEACRDWPVQPLLERDHLGPLPRVQISVKISALYSQLDPIDPEGGYRAVAGRLRPLLDLASTVPASVVFDMEQAETKELILSIFMRLFEEAAYRAFPHAGIALQAYRKDTESDIRWLLAWCDRRRTPIMIRLVKGAYWDSDTVRYRQRGWSSPLFEQKADTDLNYEALARLLLEHHQMVRPAFGTHNLRSLSVIETLAETFKVPAAAWEYQMIYGMAEPFQHAIATGGRRLRLYTPVGELLPGMAYLVRRLLENTSNESFLRKEYVESQPLSLLLAKPNGAAAEAPMHATKPGADQHVAVPHFSNEAVADFSHEATRQAMNAALELVRSQLGRRLDRSSSFPDPGGTELVSMDPSRPDQVVARCTGYAPGDVARIVEASAKRAQEWACAPFDQRIGVLRRTADVLRRSRWETAAWEVFEQGKPWREADADVAEAIDFLEYYAAEMGRLERPERLGRYPGEQNDVIWSPRGLTAVIAPWNFPLAIPTGMVAAALVTGNAVLFKPSERSSAIGYRLTEAFRKAGLPDGILRYLPGGPDLGRALVTSPAVATIAF